MSTPSPQKKSLYSQYSSSAQRLSDQKDYIISELKAQLFLLEKHSHNIPKVHESIKEQEAVYHAMLDEIEKIKMDGNMVQGENDQTLKTARGEIDRLRRDAQKLDDEIREEGNKRRKLEDALQSRDNDMKRNERRLHTEMSYQESLQKEMDKLSAEVIVVMFPRILTPFVNSCKVWRTEEGVMIKRWRK